MKGSVLNDAFQRVAWWGSKGSKSENPKKSENETLPPVFTSKYSNEKIIWRLSLAGVVVRRTK